MSALELALRRGEWERAALYLLLGINRAAEKLPPETLSQILDLLSENDASRGRRNDR